MLNLRGMGEQMLHCRYLSITESGRIIRLTPLTDGLCDMVRRWQDDPVVQTALHIQPGFLRSGIEHWFSSIRLDPYRLDWEIVVDDCRIGIFSVNQIDWEMRHGTIGILIGDRDQWGRGIGKAVTRTMMDYLQDQYHLRMLFALVNGDQPRADQLLTSLGFVVSTDCLAPFIPATTPEVRSCRVFAYHAAL